MYIYIRYILSWCVFFSFCFGYICITSCRAIEIRGQSISRCCPYIFYAARYRPYRTADFSRTTRPSAQMRSSLPSLPHHSLHFMFALRLFHPLTIFISSQTSTSERIYKIVKRVFYVSEYILKARKKKNIAVGFIIFKRHDY